MIIRIVRKRKFLDMRISILLKFIIEWSAMQSLSCSIHVHSCSDRLLMLVSVSMIILIYRSELTAMNLLYVYNSQFINSGIYDLCVILSTKNLHIKMSNFVIIDQCIIIEMAILLFYDVNLRFYYNISHKVRY